jgi:diphthamide biosynthesis protein 7
MATGTAVTSKQSMILDLPPSCVEFCLSHPAYFVVGTYNLEKEELPLHDGLDQEEVKEHVQSTAAAQSRNGSLLVFHLNSESM